MVKLGALLVGLLIAAGVAWDASERHYANCVEVAKATHTGKPETDAFDSAAQVEAAETEATVDRNSAVNGCSRLP